MSACESELQFHAWEKRNRPKMGEESKPITHTHTHYPSLLGRATNAHRSHSWTGDTKMDRTQREKEKGEDVWREKGNEGGVPSATC